MNYCKKDTPHQLATQEKSAKNRIRVTAARLHLLPRNSLKKWLLMKLQRHGQDARGTKSAPAFIARDDGQSR
jgi:hypothetical protein